MSLFEVRTPFFRPMWRRVVATALCLGWALVELLSGALFWAALFGAAGVVLFFQFFIAFDKGPRQVEAQQTEGGEK